MVLQTAFIGDVVYTSPLVHAIKQQYPDASISLLVSPRAKDIARCIPGVDEVITFDKHGQDAGPVGVLRMAQRIRNQRFDLLVSPHRSFRTAMLAMFTGIPMRVGYCNGLGRLAYHATVKPNSKRTSALVKDLELLEKVNIQPSGTTLRLKGPEDKQPYVRYFYRRNNLEADAKLVSLCIGAFWETKRWPAVYFASLSESLKERGYLSVLFGGPNERGIATEIENALGEPVMSCVGNSLSESAALMERCVMAVGGDSGLTHMADALGVPTVFIYGPTDQRQHSFGGKTKVLTAKVKCRPCSRHGPRRCPERHHDCMRLVSPENVLAGVKDLITFQTASVPEKNGQLNRPGVTSLPS